MPSLSQDLATDFYTDFKKTLEATILEIAGSHKYSSYVKDFYLKKGDDKQYFISKIIETKYYYEVESDTLLPVFIDIINNPKNEFMAMKANIYNVNKKVNNEIRFKNFTVKEFYTSNLKIKYDPINYRYGSTYGLEEIKSIMDYDSLDVRNMLYYEQITKKDFRLVSLEASIYIDQKVIDKFPDQVGAYLNLADAYWDSAEKENAKENYKKYVDMMKAQNKDLKKIPAYVYERM